MCCFADPTDLVRLSGLEGPSVGVICELLKPDDPMGAMARRDDCFAFAKQWNLKMISIEQLAEYRQRHPRLDDDL